MNKFLINPTVTFLYCQCQTINITGFNYLRTIIAEQRQNTSKQTLKIEIWRTYQLELRRDQIRFGPNPVQQTN